MKFFKYFLLQTAGIYMQQQTIFKRLSDGLRCNKSLGLPHAEWCLTRFRPGVSVKRQILLTRLLYYTPWSGVHCIWLVLDILIDIRFAA